MKASNVLADTISGGRAFQSLDKVALDKGID
jgi:hypothetical protein